MTGRPLGAKDKTPRKGNSGKNLPGNLKEYIEKNEKKEEVTRIVKESVQYFRRKGVKTNEEIAEGLDQYFADCVANGQIPTVEDMALALGTTRQTLWEWENKVTQNPERAEMINRAKEIIAAIDAKLAVEGKITPVTYIFRSKNYYGMRDQQEVVLSPVNPLGEDVDTEKLKQKYLENTYGILDEPEITIENPDN